MESNKDLSEFVCSPDVPVDVIVYPAQNPLGGEITAQPSKNYTTRFLLAAACAKGVSRVSNAANSDDARSMKRCLEGMGAKLSTEPNTDPSSVGDVVTIE